MQVVSKDIYPRRWGLNHVPTPVISVIKPNVGLVYSREIFNGFYVMSRVSASLFFVLHTLKALVLTGLMGLGAFYLLVLTLTR